MMLTNVPVNLWGRSNDNTAGIEWVGGEISYVKAKASNRPSGEGGGRREAGPEKSGLPPSSSTRVLGFTGKISGIAHISAGMATSSV